MRQKRKPKLTAPGIWLSGPISTRTFSTLAGASHTAKRKVVLTCARRMPSREGYAPPKMKSDQLVPNADAQGREKKNQRAAASTDLASRAPGHPRTHCSATIATMPALQKMDLQRAAPWSYDDKSGQNRAATIKGAHYPDPAETTIPGHAGPYKKLVVVEEVDGSSKELGSRIEVMRGSRFSDFASRYQLVASLIDWRQLVPPCERQRVAVIAGWVRHPSSCRFPTRRFCSAASRYF